MNETTEKSPTTSSPSPKRKLRPPPSPCACGSSSISHHQLKMGKNSSDDLLVWKYSGCAKCGLPRGKVTMINLTQLNCG